MLTAVLAVIATQAIPISLSSSTPRATSLDETVASRARRIALFSAQIAGFGCDAPTTSDQIAGCHEMQSQLPAMRHELAVLKARAGGRWVEGGEIIKTQGFLDNLFGGMLRRGGRTARRLERFFERPRVQPRREPRQSQTVERGTYRTLCVRSCDGFYWPISFSTTRSRIDKDAKTCRASCDSPVKLYFYQNPGEGLGDMIDVKGHRYADTPTAFRHQVEYDPSCRCGPLPWSEEAQAIYAARAAKDAASLGERGSAVKQASTRPRANRRKLRHTRPARYERRYRRRDAYTLGWQESR